jgi:transcriptional regulator with XRE-family HTH domain
MRRALSEKIKALRSDKGMTIEELSEKIGVSKALLSQIEDGKITPSIATLIHLSRCFGVPLSQFTGVKSAEKFTVVRAHQRKEVDRRPRYGPSKTGYHYKALAAQEGISAFHITFEEKEENEKAFFQHEGKEFLFVLEGRLELCIGDERVILEPGDSASYQSSHPHSLRGVGGTAKAIAVVYGE